MYLFFFKQRPAYELRIGDWSSDVCSSDLFSCAAGTRCRVAALATLGWDQTPGRFIYVSHFQVRRSCRSRPDERRGRVLRPARRAKSVPLRLFCNVLSILPSCRLPSASGRSEEHTSELQSLMRISYAVFCLKKKTS